MELHNIYQALLRLGMPAHPDLEVHAGTKLVRIRDLDSKPHFVVEAVARDVLAMHAWRWHGGGAVHVAPDHLLAAILVSLR